MHSILRHAILLVLIITPGIAPSLHAARGPDPNRHYRLLSRFWLPYESDDETLAIFRMDAGRKLDIDSLEEMLGDLQQTPPSPLGNDRKESGGNVIDSSHFRQNARIESGYKWVEQGRLGGGLAIESPEAVVKTPAYKELQRGEPLTLEGWFQARDMETGVLFSLRSRHGQTPAFELLRQPDGTLDVQLAGASIGTTNTAVLPPGVWQHLALIIIPTRQTLVRWVPTTLPQEIHLLVDGRPFQTFTDEGITPQLRTLNGTVEIGNRLAANAPFLGVIDEVRISSGIRTYYRLDREWPDPQAARPMVSGKPWLRDAADESLYLPLDGELAASFTPWQEAQPGQPQKEPAWRPGLRGQALMTGPEQTMPVIDASEALRLDQGSLEFWFSPVDWDNRRVQGLHYPVEYMPLIELQTLAPAADGAEQKTPERFLKAGFYWLRLLEKEPPHPVWPGAWYHVVITWEHERTSIYLNGQPMPPFTAYVQRPAQIPAAANSARLLLHPIGRLSGVEAKRTTLLDEIRLYRRALTPPEIHNAWQRYAPQPRLKELAFAHVRLESNAPLAWVDIAAELLDARRPQVASIRATLRDPAGAMVGTQATLPVQNGRAAARLSEMPVDYGLHLLQLEFLNASNATVDTMELPHDRPRPPWLDNTLGIHPGKVLPGWEPMTVEDGATIGLLGRRIRMGGDGWPQSIQSRGEELLARPLRPDLVVSGKALELTAAAEAPVIESHDDAQVTTLGELHGQGWNLTTRITVQFDGLMETEVTVTPPETGAVLDKLTLDIALPEARALFHGFWTGARNFRASTHYGLLPERQGVLFESNKPGKARHEQLRGSFIPYVYLGDDWRGLAWFAESDRGWTQDEEHSAVQILRADGEVILRLNIIQRPLAIETPHTIVMGLMPTPVKQLDPEHRAKGTALNFGWVDSFSKQDLKTDDAATGNFQIWPADYDWQSAAARAETHRYHYGNDAGYAGPFLYIDRNWVVCPPNATEFAPIWYRSGFFRYLPEARDCHIWHMHGWLSRHLIRGIYIDDIWINTARDPATGPAHLLADGHVQPGFEFFDYHAYLKRLRWLFHDAGLEPQIWIHMTETPLIPCISFADYLLDGEWKFIDWGRDTNFMKLWPHDRMRFANGEKLGITQVWMNKIGNDIQPKPGGIEHWHYRQARAYAASLLLHDISDVNNVVPREILKHLTEPGSELTFDGYWTAEPAVVSTHEQIAVSLYRAHDHALLLIVNRGDVQEPVSLKLLPERLGIDGLTLATLRIEDVDTWRAPPGQDVTRLAPPQLADPDKKPEGDLAELFDEAFADAAKDELRQQGIFVFDDHNFQQDDATLTLRVRPWDFRLLRISR